MTQPIVRRRPRPAPCSELCAARSPPFPACNLTYPSRAVPVRLCAEPDLQVSAECAPLPVPGCAPACSLCARAARSTAPPLHAVADDACARACRRKRACRSGSTKTRTCGSRGGSLCAPHRTAPPPWQRLRRRWLAPVCGWTSRPARRSAPNGTPSCAWQGFDEYMNLVLDEAEELSLKKKTKKALGAACAHRNLRTGAALCSRMPSDADTSPRARAGRILLKGDNITLMMNATPPAS